MAVVWFFAGRRWMRLAAYRGNRLYVWRGGMFIGQALKQAGFQIWYVPQVTVEHHDGASVKQHYVSRARL